MPKHMMLNSNIRISRELSRAKYHINTKLLLTAVTHRAVLCKEEGMGNTFTFVKPKKGIILQ